MAVLGLVVLVIGVVLLAIEAHISTAGILAAGGIVALVVGAVLALDGAGAGVAIAVPVGVATGAIAGGGFVVASRRLARARHGLPRGGATGIAGHIGVVRTWDDDRGRVLVDGALWGARSEYPEEQPIENGDCVVVDGVRGLTLTVRKAEEWEVQR